MPYQGNDIHCFMCKEKLKVEKDGLPDVEAGKMVQTSNGLGGILAPYCDENCYFVDAKRIRVSIRNKETN